MMNIVLFEPEIPQNTGNIGRTCVAAAARLHLIGPMGFKINEKAVKRAGMDYWKDLDVTEYDGGFSCKKSGSEDILCHHQGKTQVYGCKL